MIRTQAQEGNQTQSQKRALLQLWRVVALRLGPDKGPGPLQD